MAETKISWATHSWSPITGCSKISPGCHNCYALRMAYRLKGRCGYPADKPFAVTFHEDKLDEPLRWKKPARVFVCSMGDWMHDSVKTEWLDSILEIIGECPQHQFLTLTKRPYNLLSKLYGNPSPNCGRYYGGGDYLLNLWMGVTCEDQKWAEKRIPELLKIPATIRWMSLEPLLGPINLSTINIPRQEETRFWVVVGCESGPGRRPCKIEWIRDIVQQCQRAGVACFVKQIEIDGKVSHEIEQFPKDLQIREFPQYPKEQNHER